MNDPYEWRCVRSDHEPSQRALEQTAHQTFDEYGVACFGRTCTNLLMWSYYGDRHKGICLGFEVPDEVIREVKYIPKIEVVDNIRDLPSTQLNIEGSRILDKLFASKYEGWSYESEVRVNGLREEVDEESGYYFTEFSDAVRLKEVVAGARFPMNRKVIERALQGYSEEVKIVKATTAANRFEVLVDEWKLEDD